MYQLKLTQHCRDERHENAYAENYKNYGTFDRSSLFLLYNFIISATGLLYFNLTKLLVLLPGEYNLGQLLNAAILAYMVQPTYLLRKSPSS